MSDSFPSHGLYSLWNSPSQNIGVGSSSLLQFPSLPNAGTEPWSPALQADSVQLSHEGSPRIQEQLAYPICSGSS